MAASRAAWASRSRLPGAGAASIFACWNGMAAIASRAFASSGASGSLITAIAKASADVNCSEGRADFGVHVVAAPFRFGRPARGLNPPRAISLSFGFFRFSTTRFDSLIKRSKKSAREPPCGSGAPRAADFCPRPPGQRSRRSVRRRHPRTGRGRGRGARGRGRLNRGREHAERKGRPAGVAKVAELQNRSVAARSMRGLSHRRFRRFHRFRRSRPPRHHPFPSCGSCGP
jgi:hypothetical protein